MEHRCERCQRLLCTSDSSRFIVGKNTVTVKCPRCKHYNTVVLENGVVEAIY